MNSRPVILASLFALLCGCSSPNRPGQPVKDISDLTGCYKSDMGLKVRLTGTQMLMSVSDTIFEIKYLRDKHGKFVMAQPPFWLEYRRNSGISVNEASGTSSLVRIEERNLIVLVFTTRSGEFITARKQAC